MDDINDSGLIPVGIPQQDEEASLPHAELPELLGICDRIYTLSAGRITADIDRQDADQEILMRHMTQVKED